MPKRWTLLDLFRKPMKNRNLGITYEVVYIPPHLRERLERR